MAWIKVHNEIIDSWKILKLSSSLGIPETQSIGHIICLWLFVERMAWETGNLENWGAIGISKAAKWLGDPDSFVAAMRDCRLLDGWVIHEWQDHQSSMIHDRFRRLAGKTQAESPRNPQLAGENARLDKIRLDEIREKKQHMSDKSDHFDQFWKAYPNKTGKGAALVAWKKKNPPIDKCLATITVMSKSAQWTKESGQYIPNPATWINQERWNDVPKGMSSPERKMAYEAAAVSYNTNDPKGWEPLK